MSLLTIDSVPSGARVEFDGEFVGLTPVSISTPSKNLLEFRETCMDGDQISCGWEVLEVWLEDHRVSGFWWEMTTPERRSVAIKAIKNTLYEFCDRWSDGAPGCGGDYGNWRLGECSHNAAIRYVKFCSPVGLGPCTGTSVDECYYKGIADTPTCYRPDTWYDLCAHWVTCGSVDSGHFMASIQVDPDVTSLDSWIVFQYRDVDIKPGSLQMPFGTSVRFLVVSRLGCRGSAGSRVATFEV